MDTQAWLDIVTPSQGLRILALPYKQGFKHTYHRDNFQTAQIAAQLDARGSNVFYALSGFTDTALDKERDATGKLVRGGRKQANVGWVRAFWADLDCGDGKGFATQRDALLALKGFIALTGLEQPYIVSSGRGIHLYWPLDADVTRAEWKAVAVTLKQAFVIARFAADPTRTADEASVLRPVGVHHRKAEPIPVRLLKAGRLWSYAEFRDQIAAFLEANEVLPDVPREPKSSLNSDLGGGINEYPPADANQIADQCGVLDWVRQSQGWVEQPAWYRTLGVVAFCTDADQIAQEWSCGHPDYTPEATAAKLAQVGQYAPTTCAKLRECAPEICAACPHDGVLKSPIKLGFANHDVVVPAVPPAAAAPAAPALALPAPTASSIEFPWPYRYVVEDGRPCLQLRSQDKEGEVSWITFCNTLFYLTNRVNVAANGYVFEVTMYVRTKANGEAKEVRTFMVPGSVIGGGGKELACALGKYEIAPTHPSQKPIMDAYLTAWMTKLRGEADEIAQLGHFGWHGDAFLVGNTLITPSGNRQALLADIAASKKDALVQKGDLATWIDAVHRAYDHPGQEHLQFQVVLAFAAPLFSLLEDYGGITVFAHSEGSGAGKTTAQRAALSAWGDYRDLQLSDGKITANMLWGFLGCYHNLPVMYDELTNMTDAAASALVYDVSSGRPKDRMTPEGLHRTNNHRWSTIFMASGNNLLSEKLAQHRANAEAELVRMFEFTCPMNSPLSPNEALDIFSLLLDNYGHAGISFAQYIVPRKDRLTKAMRLAVSTANTEAGLTQSERYWGALFASVSVALALCNKLGLLRFDAKNIKQWMYDRLLDNRVQRVASVNTPTDTFGRMLTDLWSGVLITIGDGSVMSGKPAIVPDGVRTPLHGQLTGRVVLPYSDEKNKKPMLYLNAASVREWTNKKRISAREMLTNLAQAGLASPTPVRVALGRGMQQYGSTSSPVPCWAIDISRLTEIQGQPGLVDRLSVIPGGLTAGGSSDE